MVRRRSGGKKSASKPKPPRERKSDSRMTKWKTADDIPMDEEEQCKDKILLDGEEDDSNDEEEEVFALKGMSDEDEDEEEGGDGDDHGMDVDEDAKPSEPKQKKEKGKQKGKKAAAPSDSEDEEEEETWGKQKSAYYSSNAAQIDSDDEEANELEEQEALRLQSKAREALTEDAFGLDEPFDEDTQDNNIIVDDVQKPSVPLPQDKQAILAHLAKTCPETLALARDWDDTATNLMKTKQKIEAIQSDGTNTQSLGMLHFYYQGLVTYAATLAFYLHIRSSEKYSQRPELLQSHPIIPRLLSLKQSLSGLEELDFAPSDSDDEDDDDEEESDDLMDAQTLWKLARREGLDRDELRELIMDAMESGDIKDGPDPQMDEDLPESGDVADVHPPPKKKKKVKSSEKAKKKKPTFDLMEPEFEPGSSGAASTAFSDLADPYGEATSLQSADAADKTARRKTLRFHTSKIESAGARRQGARQAALGGDDDLPYRDRRKERDAKLASKKLGQGGEDLDDADPQPRGQQDSDDGSGEDQDADGYYELVKSRVKAKKEQKKAEYEEARESARPVLDGESVDGPRSLTRSILKNKGLTPRRTKEVRNPRVKKRQKFEKAKKKIASQKAVYKGGLAETGYYAGEKTGISKVRKGVRLS